MMGSYHSVDAFTRTADTNAYTALDVVGSATAAGGAVRKLMAVGPVLGGEARIKSVSLEIDIAAVPSGMTSFRAYLYSATPASNLGDNAAWDIASNDRPAFLGYVDLGTPVDLGSTLYVKTDEVNMQITVPAGGNLFYYLVTNGGYTPGSADKFTVKFHAVDAIT
jgi:hypothetical protein